MGQPNQTATERSALDEAVRWAQFEPVTFAREILQIKRLPGEPSPGDEKFNPNFDWELDDWLIELLEATADVYRKQKGLPTKFNHEGKKYITIRAAQGPGKTFGIALIAHIFGFAFDPVVIPVVAPKLDHLKTRFMGEFNKIAQRAIPGYRSLMKIGTLRVYWNVKDPANHLLVCETAKQPENIQGLRRRFTLCLIDEASGVDEAIWPVTEGNLSATDVGIRVEIGNPTRNTGHFARSHRNSRTEQDYYRMHVGPEHSRRIAPEWIARMVRSYGEHSPVVQVRCFGNFADSSPRQLIPLAWAIDAIERDVRPLDGSLRRLRASVDVSDGGDDETVVWIKEIWQSFEVLLKVKRFSFAAVDAVARAADAAEEMFYAAQGRKGVDDIVVDSLGVGAGTRDILIRRGHRVIEYMGGAGSDDPVRWRNRRVQSYLCLRDALRDGQLDFAPDCFVSGDDQDEFLAQLAAIELTEALTGERLEDLVTKTEMKRKGFTSPDIADALAMSFATQRPVTAMMDGFSLAQALCVVPGTDHRTINAGGSVY
jgi:hypothetical protein